MRHAERSRLVEGGKGTRRASRGIAVLLAGAALAGVAVACSDQDGNIYLHFTNSTDGPIEIVLLDPTTGNEYLMESEIKAGMTSVTRSDVYPGTPCAARGVLIARDVSGSEIARRTGEICKGDTWVVRDETRASPS